MPKKTDIIVKESNALARARITPRTDTVWDERVISTIAAKNRQDDLDFREQTLDVKELTSTKTLSTRQHSEAKNAIRALAHKTFEVPMGRRGVVVYPIFAKLAIDDNGIITGKFNPELKEHYLELTRQFAMRALPEFQALMSIYSQQLFRFLNSWKSEPEKTVPLDEFHAMLDTPQSFRKNFQALRTRVLEPAHREINASTSLEFDWEPVKEGLRKTVAVRFIFDVTAKCRAETIEQIKELKSGRAKPERSPEDEAIDLYQSESNACYEKFYFTLRKDCAPHKRSKKCQYCVERGRMRARLMKTGESVPIS
jgi:plasmid replication initiation protein